MILAVVILALGVPAVALAAIHHVRADRALAELAVSVRAADAAVSASMRGKS